MVVPLSQLNADSLGIIYFTMFGWENGILVFRILLLDGIPTPFLILFSSVEGIVVILKYKHCQLFLKL